MRSIDDMTGLENGWTREGGEIYHFEHIALPEAELMAQARDELFVVETINWTFADDKTLHYNKYFAFTMSSAIALAARIEILAQDVAETTVGIRLATTEEVSIYLKVSDYYDEHEEAALSDGEAESLQGE